MPRLGRRFEGAGFKPYSEEFIPTVASMHTEIDVRLADIDSEQASGSAGREPSILKIDRTDVSTTITRQEIERLPIYNQYLTCLESLVYHHRRTAAPSGVRPESRMPRA